MKNKYGNYAGNAREFLKKRNLGLWSEVKAEIEDFSMQGLIAPAPEGTTEVIYLKLPNGYNTAFAVDRIKSIEKTGTAKVEYKITAEKVEKQPTLPTVHVLGAGGTVASKIDYRTGAVKASFSTSEIVTAIPELTDIANIDTTLLFNIFSENMTSTHWKKIAKETAKLLTSGVDGVVITHGTDTMHYTSAALSFMLAKLPAPVILTGSQRSSDRPASDAASNLKVSVRLAGEGTIAEVAICMHASSSDTKFFVHRGTRVRKMHSSRRDTFRTLADFPLAEIRDAQINYIKENFTTRGSHRPEDLRVDATFEEKTALVWMYPGIAPEILERLIDEKYRGIVLAGTGLGHTPKHLYSTIERGVEEGTIFVMTTQCLNGKVDMNVYETGRDLQHIGVVSGESMLPSTAYVKLGWLLGHEDWGSNTITEKVQQNYRGEILQRESPVAFFKQPLPP